MPLDRSKVSEGPATEEGVRRFSRGGWGFFAKTMGGEWRSYFLDGENGVIKDEAVAREMYDIALKDPRAEAAILIRITGVEQFDRRPKEWSPRKAE